MGSLRWCLLIGLALSSAVLSAPRPTYSVLALDELTDGQALRANNGSFSVGVQIQPPLQATPRLRLLLDGQPYGPASGTTQWHLQNIDRGEHSLAVQVLATDKVIQQSPTLRFTVLRVRKR